MDQPVVARGAGRTETGPVRRTNEDALCLDEAVGLFVVADGMGGHNAGEVASQLAVETIAGFIKRTDEDSEFSWPYGIVPTLSYNSNRLRTAVCLANRRVYRTAENQDDYVGMGTTVVAALFSRTMIVIAHVGDSRAYRLRNGTAEQLTRDDSWVATVLAEDPSADPGLAANHPMRHVLTNALGARDDAEVHVQEQPIQPGDVILLCTDGVHGVLDASSIGAALGSPGDLDTKVGDLIGVALSQGSRDNLTAVVVVPTREESPA